MDNDELQTKLKIAEEALLAEISSNAHQPAEMKKLRDKLIEAEERIEDLRLDLQDYQDRNY